MRLINTFTLALEEFFGDDIPRYAILSHTWGPEEVTFQDWKDLSVAREKKGFQKIELARNQAIMQDLKYLWVDTNCINKESSSELAEAINSMFAWYRDAEVCYAYLSDVSEEEDADASTSKNALSSRLSASQWFTRGWTLQELLAPRQVLFFSREWRQVGTRKALVNSISRITGIDSAYMYHKKKRFRSPISAASVAERMSWLSRRKTTRVEDMAYCMLGIFDINMPLLYGESSKAFTRLQEELLKVSTDESLFCWSWNEDDPATWSSMLAPSPRNFRNALGYRAARDETSRPVPYSMTNFGLSIQLPIARLARIPLSKGEQWLRSFEYIAILSASTADGHLIGIPLERTMTADTYRTIRDCPRPVSLVWNSLRSVTTDDLGLETQRIFVPSRESGLNLQRPQVKSFDQRLSLGDYAVLLLPFINVPSSSSKPHEVQNMEAIPKYNKSKGGFIKMKRFTIAGPPDATYTSRPDYFHATEVHGAMVRFYCEAFGTGNGPLCLLVGVLVSEEGKTRWFNRILGHVSEDVEFPRRVPFTHRSLETMLVSEASEWQVAQEFSASGSKLAAQNGRVTTALLGPEFLAEANYQKTVARALHLTSGVDP